MSNLLTPVAGEQVLNPRLYQLLEQRLGDVHISDQGSRMQYAVSRDLRRPGRQQVHVQHPGEYYIVSCPLCSDTRHRLWINHMYGTPDPNGFPMYWLAKCFNEDCLNSQERREDLARLIFGLRNRNERPPAMPIRRGHSRPTELGQVGPPGEMYPLHQLPADHPACEYVRSRGFDPVELSQRYGVSYCQQALPQFWRLTGRLTVPIYMHRTLVGWQGRYLADYPRELWKTLDISKFYSMPRMPTSRILFNHDAAQAYPFGVVVEGVFDVFRVGGPAVGILGKSMGLMQRTLLESSFRGKPLFLMLDPDAREAAREIIFELRRSAAFTAVIDVVLPDGRDPGSTDRAVIWETIRAAAAARGLDPSLFRA